MIIFNEIDSLEIELGEESKLSVWNYHLLKFDKNIL